MQPGRVSIFLAQGWLARLGASGSNFAGNVTARVSDRALEIIEQMLLVAKLCQHTNAANQVDVAWLHTLDQDRYSLLLELLHDIDQDSCARGIEEL